MKVSLLLPACAVAIIVAFTGTALAAPLVFAGRVLPGISLGSMSLAGLEQAQLEQAVTAFAEELDNQTIQLHLRDQQVETTLGEIGLSINQEETIQRIGTTSFRDVLYGNHQVTPSLTFTDNRLTLAVARLFPNTITPPENASFTLSGPELLTVVPSRRGEQVDQADLRQQIARRLQQGDWQSAIELNVTEEDPAVNETELEDARQLATELLTDGLNFLYGEEVYQMKPFTIRRLVTFVPQTDPNDPENKILGVELDHAGVKDYLVKTLAPEIDQEAQNARFTLSEEEGVPRVAQFALPETGQTLNINRTLSHIATSLERHERVVPLAIDVSTPEVTELADIEQLGLTSLLAVGESDFVGSPNNRIHNIDVGASRYHGILLPPGKEFSFNEFLGPVDGAHGFLPELVIKHNVTTPEYGGGLCQVSTTVFRAALNAGLEITDRRNHAYAVSYYGTPGTDATIYPPYTDLKFRNNTPGYILMQTRLDGTKLNVEFWGTDDGREVVVSGPVNYDRQPDGAVKAYVEQKVIKDGQPLIEETFYSRYKSPKLFPKVLSANGEATPTPTPAPVPSATSPANGAASPTVPESSTGPTSSPTPSPAVNHEPAI